MNLPILVATTSVSALALSLSIAIPAWANATFALIAQAPASTKVIHVNPTLGADHAGTGSSEQNPYRTITYALRQAQAGTVIQLAPGRYTRESGEIFPLIIAPGVVLRGNESTKGQHTVLHGGGSYISPTFSRQSITVWAGTGSEIRGVTVTNPNSRGTGVWVESTSPTVQNNTFINSLREGEFVTGTGAPKITHNVFMNNTANGISVAWAAQGEIRGNLFQKTGFGIAISEEAAPLLVENRVIHNRDGVVISHSARPVLRQNVIENNIRSGVVVITNAHPDLGTASSPGNNIIRRNGQDLYNLTSSDTLPTTGNQIGTLIWGKTKTQSR